MSSETEKHDLKESRFSLSNNLIDDGKVYHADNTGLKAAQEKKEHD